MGRLTDYFGSSGHASPSRSSGRNYKPVFSGVISIADINKYNKELRSWAAKTRWQLKAGAASKTKKGKTKTRISKDKFGNSFKETILSKDIRYNIKKAYGEVERIGFTFPRHGVFFQKGVGNKHGIANPRTSVDWFNAVIERNITELENIVAKYYEVAAVNATQILIQ